MTEYIYGTDDHEGHWLTGDEIVRCRDCEFSMFDKECSRVDPWEDETWFAIEPDGFCKWGERKEVGE